MSDLGKPVSALTPGRMSQIMRDPDDGPDALYPARIGVFCDADSTIIDADFIVNDRMTKPERLELIRQYARERGWKCTPLGDFCPPCVASAVDVDVS